MEKLLPSVCLLPLLPRLPSDPGALSAELIYISSGGRLEFLQKLFLEELLTWLENEVSPLKNVNISLKKSSDHLIAAPPLPET